MTGYQVGPIQNVKFALTFAPCGEGKQWRFCNHRLCDGYAGDAAAAAVTVPRSSNV